jgi:hypothetical protein
VLKASFRTAIACRGTPYYFGYTFYLRSADHSRLLFHSPNARLFYPDAMGYSPRLVSVPSAAQLQAEIQQRKTADIATEEINTGKDNAITHVYLSIKQPLRREDCNI